MSRAAVRQFIEDVLTQETLQEKWNAAADVPGLAALAVEQGHAVDEDDIRWAIEALQKLQKHELSDEELQQVSGGASLALPGDQFSPFTIQNVDSLTIGATRLLLPKLY